MLKCKDIVAHAGDYLDAEQTFFQRLQFRLHLLICLHCRRFLRHLRVAVAVASRCAPKTTDPQQAADIAGGCRQHPHH